MHDSEPTGDQPVAGQVDGPAGGSPAGAADQPPPRKTTRRRSASRAKAADAADSAETDTGPPGAESTAPPAEPGAADTSNGDADEGDAAPVKKATRTRRKKATPAATGSPGGDAAATPAGPSSTAPLFLAPDTPAAEAEPAAASATGRRRTRRTADTQDSGDTASGKGRSPATRKATAKTTAKTTAAGEEQAQAGDAAPPAGDDSADDEGGSETQRSRRRGRRGRGRGKGAGSGPTTPGDDAEEPDDTGGAEDAGEADDEGETDAVKRRRRRRRRKGSSEPDPATEDSVQTVVKVRESRGPGDEVRGVTGSTRLEAKRQRRRGGRDQRRTRPPVLSESEFLARREAVDRVMVIREHAGRTQIGVLEDGVLVEHYVSRAAGNSIAGSVYLGKVQNVLPSMEAAFVDVGRGRNAVLYAGEVNWDVTGLEGKSRSIEQALKSGDSVMVQVTKDPVGNKGARLTSSIALSGRHLVYVPHGNASGISRKLPDTERRRLRAALKSLVPDGAGVIVRTAAEGATEDELTRDVKRLQAQWEDIQARAGQVSAPALLYSEPDLVVRVVRDLFNEDFRELVIEGDSAYETVEAYLAHVSPDLVDRLRRHSGTADVFATHRVEEQILKGLDRKVYLPSGGHLVIDRTEAMTVIDVNTGKYTGTGGNLEETVTRNNLEAAEEIVRQLRLRDIGGIIVIDFIDMVLESNRDLVLRRLTECLGRDRTKHQVTEITSLGLVQMTRKRVGAGLLEVFSETCECCKGRGVVVNLDPPAASPKGRDAAAKVKAVASASSGGERRRRGSRARPGATDEDQAVPEDAPDPSPAAAEETVAVPEPIAPTPSPEATDADAPPGVGASQVENSQVTLPEVELPEPGDDRDLDEDGLGGMFRRFRRSGSRRTRP